jgi:hypothetical protein
VNKKLHKYNRRKYFLYKKKNKNIRKQTKVKVKKKLQKVILWLIFDNSINHFYIIISYTLISFKESFNRMQMRSGSVLKENLMSSSDSSAPKLNNLYESSKESA